MPLAILARRFTLLFFAALCPALAFALNGTYEGRLLPDSLEAPIPIVVELRDVGSTLTGNVRTSSPLTGNAPIASGEERFGQCNMRVVLNSSVTLRLYGSCQPTVFEGKYTIYYTQLNAQSKGSFRLTKKATEPAKKESARSATASTIAACLKANTHCLTACPRGDQSTEFMCANRCRTKLQACKGQANKLPEVAPRPEYGTQAPP